MIVLGVAVAGACGAVLRYLVDHVVQRRFDAGFPLGILVVNLSGSLVLGFLTGSAVHHGVSPTWLTVAGTGLIGAYTTFSTFTFDSVLLAEDRRWGAAALNVGISLGLGLGAAALGLALGSLT
ncbi:MAG TPA: fluoride efflux transporter CrcB [Acidimicrobiales bacterium]|jgi:CrcB protein|nr:fluoride efflux transporter CrcB [Acidimicrobiales bacterium]